ncbi:MAG: hypothetical protein EBQ92_07475 [Proteobacteria bacterium]|nr:hypothetical protein [Pseudomonadota bacterium]
MSRARAKNRMKLISGGKQLCLIRDTEEVLKFLEFTAKTGSEAPAIIEARQSACTWCFSLLKEEEDHVAWILDNLPVVLSRQSEVTGEKLEDFSQLIVDALEDYRSWSSDPFGWERKHANPSSQPPREVSVPPKNLGRTLTLPVRADLCIEVKMPEGGISTEDFLRLGLFLYPYCNDLDLTKTFSWLSITEKN